MFATISDVYLIFIPNDIMQIFGKFRPNLYNHSCMVFLDTKKLLPYDSMLLNAQWSIFQPYSGRQKVNSLKTVNRLGTFRLPLEKVWVNKVGKFSLVTGRQLNIQNKLLPDRMRVGDSRQFFKVGVYHRVSLYIKLIYLIWWQESLRHFCCIFLRFYYH